MGLWSDFKREYGKGARRRRPWFAAVLNFLVWGLGYLYAGRRRLLGFALFLFVFTAFVAGGLLYESFYLAVGMVFAAWLFVSAALARDAYLETKNRTNEKTSRGEKGG